MRAVLRIELICLLLVLPVSVLAQPVGVTERGNELTVKSITLSTGATLQYADMGNPDDEALLFIHGSEPAPALVPLSTTPRRPA